MSVERRLLDVLEAATVCREPLEAWAGRVTSSLSRAVTGGIGAAALAFDAETKQLDLLAPCDPRLEQLMAAGQSSLDEPHHDAVYGRASSAQTAYELFAGRVPKALVGALQDVGASDVLGVANRTNAKGSGVSFAVTLRDPRALDERERRQLRGLGAQLALAYRVRGAVERLSDDVGEPDALRDGLAGALRELERRRGRRRSQAYAEDAVRLWERLLAEGWVVLPVEVHDGRTRLVAVRTLDGEAATLRRLPVVEREVVRRAALGLSNKEIGFQLRLSEGTVAERLHRAQQRLGVRRRATLVRLFGDLP